MDNTAQTSVRHPAAARSTDRRTAPAEPPPPGEFPFTRGNFPSGYRGRLWTFRQYSGFGTAEESNRRYRYLLEQGGTGLSVALDLPTQCGYDSDDPEFGEEVGRVGVAVDTLADAEILFDGIPLDKISTSFTINGTAAILLAFYVAAAEKTGRAAGEAHRHHPERHPQGVRLARHLDLAAGAVAAADRRHHRVLRGRGAAVQRDLGGRRALPRRRAPTRCRRWPSRWPTASPTATPWSTRGRMTIDQFAPQISFFFYTHGDFFEEIAKYRAGRRRWATIVRERYGATTDKASMFRFGCVCRRRVAVRAAGAEQPGAGRLRGDGRGARRRAVDVHRRLGRAVRAAQRGVRDAGAAHPADPRLRDRRDQGGRSARRLLLRRGAHRRHRGTIVEIMARPRDSTAAWCGASRTATCRA